MSTEKQWGLCESTQTVPITAQEAWFGLTSRREALVRLAATALPFLGLSPAVAQTVIRPESSHSRVLVVVFLRGGADGLALVTPKGEDNYFRLRPTLASERQLGASLGDEFALHPGFKFLAEAHLQRHLSVVHAVGSADESRSHFEAMRTMESGAESGEETRGGGWIARYLNATQSRSSALRAVAIGGLIPDSLRGSAQGVALSSLDDLKLNLNSKLGTQSEVFGALKEMYGGANDLFSQAGYELLNVIEQLKTKSVAADSALPEDASEFRKGMRDIATLIRMNVGLEVACIDHYPWDTHVTQGLTEGWIANNVADLDAGLGEFWNSLGEHRARVSVLVMTEFGRRVQENIAQGTDHGRASVAFVLDEQARSEQSGVLGQWPGLSNSQLDEVGDLKVGTDYRSILSELVAERLDASSLPKILPGFTAENVGLFRKT